MKKLFTLILICVAAIVRAANPTVVFDARQITGEALSGVMVSFTPLQLSTPSSVSLVPRFTYTNVTGSDGTFSQSVVPGSYRTEAAWKIRGTFYRDVWTNCFADTNITLYAGDPANICVSTAASTNGIGYSQAQANARFILRDAGFGTNTTLVRPIISDLLRWYPAGTYYAQAFTNITHGVTNYYEPAWPLAVGSNYCWFVKSTNAGIVHWTNGICAGAGGSSSETNFTRASGVLRPTVATDVLSSPTNRFGTVSTTNNVNIGGTNFAAIIAGTNGQIYLVPIDAISRPFGLMQTSTTNGWTTNNHTNSLWRYVNQRGNYLNFNQPSQPGSTNGDYTVNLGFEGPYFNPFHDPQQELWYRLSFTNGVTREPFGIDVRFETNYGGFGEIYSHWNFTELDLRSADNNHTLVVITDDGTNGSFGINGGILQFNGNTNIWPIRIGGYGVLSFTNGNTPKLFEGGLGTEVLTIFEGADVGTGNTITPLRIGGFGGNYRRVRWNGTNGLWQAESAANIWKNFSDNLNPSQATLTEPAASVRGLGASLTNIFQVTLDGVKQVTVESDGTLRQWLGANYLSLQAVGNIQGLTWSGAPIIGYDIGGSQLLHITNAQGGPIHFGILGGIPARLTTTGLGLGTNSPAGKLHTHGAVYANGLSTNSSVVSFIGRRSDGEIVETATVVGGGAGGTTETNAWLWSGFDTNQSINWGLTPSLNVGTNWVAMQPSNSTTLAFANAPAAGTGPREIFLLVYWTNAAGTSFTWPASVVWPDGQAPGIIAGRTNLYWFTWTGTNIIGSAGQTTNIYAEIASATAFTNFLTTPQLRNMTNLPSYDFTNSRSINLAGNPIPFTNILVAGWGQSLTTNSGVVTATLTNRPASIATNATSTTVGFSDTENVQIYNTWFHLTTNLVVSPTNLIVGRTICVRFDTNALTFDVTVTNTAANPVNWNFNVATNGSTSFTKTNSLRARLYLTAETNGVISAEFGYYR